MLQIFRKVIERAERQNPERHISACESGGDGADCAVAAGSDNRRRSVLQRVERGRMEPGTVGLPDRRVGAGRMQRFGNGLRGVGLVSGFRIHKYRHPRAHHVSVAILTALMISGYDAQRQRLPDR